MGAYARYRVVLEQPPVITSIDGLQFFMVTISKKRLHCANEAVGEPLRVLDVDVECLHAGEHLEQFHNPFAFQSRISGSRCLDVDRLNSMDCAGTTQCVKAVTELLDKFLETVDIEGEPTELSSYDE